MPRGSSGERAVAVAGHGIAVRLVAPWEARLYLRERPEAAAGVHPAAFGQDDEVVNPVLHLANFALPPNRGDFGTGAVERMTGGHAFVSFVEYNAEEAGTALFEHRGIPRPSLRDFAPNQLQRRLPGQLGRQEFFTHEGRAFCLYVVLGSRSKAPALLSEVHDVLDHLEVTARGGLTV